MGLDSYTLYTAFLPQRTQSKHKAHKGFIAATKFGRINEIDVPSMGTLKVFLCE
jgi:hypothetical protein